MLAGFIRQLGLLLTDVRLIPAFVCAIALIQSIEEDVKSANTVDVDSIADLVVANLLGVNYGVRRLNIEGGLDARSLRDGRQVRPQAAVNGNKLRLGACRNLRLGEVLVEQGKIGFIEIVRPFGYANLITLGGSLSHRELVQLAQALDSD